VVSSVLFEGLLMPIPNKKRQAKTVPQVQVDEIEREWTIEFEMELSLYDGASIFCDGIKIGQLIMIRSERSRELVKKLTQAGVKFVQNDYKLTSKGPGADDRG
jgi:hypothetical protein